MEAQLDRVVFSAGTHPVDIPILVVCPSRLTSPVEFGLLLRHALRRFDSIITTGPYSLILFASPSSEHAPSVKQLIGSYPLISRPIRKNLHSFWIVHPSFWSKFTLQLFLKTVVSAKLARKLTWVNDLSTLASLVPFHQICIPPEVYKHDLAFHPSIVLPPSLRQPPVFQTPLEQLMGSDSQLGLPQVIRDCTNCIRSSGLKSEGLFRRPPSLTTTQIIRDAYDRRQAIKIEDYPDAPFLAASLIKLFLRGLPEPIFRPELYPIIKTCPSIHPQPLIPSPLRSADLNPSNALALQYINDHVLSCLGKPARVLLDCVLKLSHDIALHSDHNKMDPHNLATCLAPTMIRSNDLLADAMMCKLPNPGSPTGDPTDITNRNPGFTTFSSILKFVISCYPLVEKIPYADLGPVGSYSSMQSGLIVQARPLTRSSTKPSSSKWTGSTTSTSIYESNSHYSQYGTTNPIGSMPSSVQRTLKKGYLPIRCPVSQVGLSHAFTLDAITRLPISPTAARNSPATLQVYSPTSSTFPALGYHSPASDSHPLEDLD